MIAIIINYDWDLLPLTNKYPWCETFVVGGQLKRAVVLIQINLLSEVSPLQSVKVGWLDLQNEKGADCSHSVMGH